MTHSSPSALRRPVDDSDHVRGELRTASVVLVEYGDFQCPFCSQARRMLDSLRRSHADRIALVWRHLPITEHHEHAEPAARAAEAASRQGRFWDMHDRLFDRQTELDAEHLERTASDLGLDPFRFKADMDDPALAARVADDRRDAIESGLNATPSFYIDGDLLRGDWRTLHRQVSERLLVDSAPDGALGTLCSRSARTPG